MWWRVLISELNQSNYFIGYDVIWYGGQISFFWGKTTLALLDPPCLAGFCFLSYRSSLLCHFYFTKF